MCVMLYDALHRVMPAVVLCRDVSCFAMCACLASYVLRTEPCALFALRVMCLGSEVLRYNTPCMWALYTCLCHITPASVFKTRYSMRPLHFEMCSVLVCCCVCRGVLMCSWQPMLKGHSQCGREPQVTVQPSIPLSWCLSIPLKPGAW